MGSSIWGGLVGVVTSVWVDATHRERMLIFDHTRGYFLPHPLRFTNGRHTTTRHTHTHQIACENVHLGNSTETRASINTATASGFQELRG